MTDTKREIEKLIEIIEADRRDHERCPWNPFPAQSVWGRMIDEKYRHDRARMEADQ